MSRAIVQFGRSLLALATLATLGCSRQIETKITGNTSAADGKTLIELAAYLFDKNEFKNCDNPQLEPLDVVWNLNPEQRRIAEEIAADLPASELSAAAIEYATDIDIEISARDRESIVMYLFKIASERGDPVALSEIGASLLFCYQHVAQDLPEARYYLERAAEAGDSYAMRSLASMHLSGLTDDEDAEQKGRDLIEKCRKAGNLQCA